MALAARQHCVVTASQLASAGWSKDQIASRAQAGWLRRVHRGVYLVGPLETPHTASMAAVMAYGKSALASHHPAAVLWDWRPPREGPVHVIAGGRSRPGVIVHHAELDPRDRTLRHGVPVTSAARTLLDLAATEPTAELERALNEAFLQRHVSSRSLDEQFRRYPNHRGTAALRAAQEEPHLTRSDAEILARDLISAAELPVPESNVRIEGYEVDLLWREQRLIVEIDSWAFHSERRSFEGDRRRDQCLVGAGWRVVRVTGRQLIHGQHAVVATLATALAA
jgi:hypothetical protein